MMSSLLLGQLATLAKDLVAINISFTKNSSMTCWAKTNKHGVLNSLVTKKQNKQQQEKKKNMVIFQVKTAIKITLVSQNKHDKDKKYWGEQTISTSPQPGGTQLL